MESMEDIEKEEGTDREREGGRIDKKEGERKGGGKMERYRN